MRLVPGDSNDDEAVMAAIATARSLGTFSVSVSATGVVIRSPRLVDAVGVAMAKEVLQRNLELPGAQPLQATTSLRCLSRSHPVRRAIPS